MSQEAPAPLGERIAYHRRRRGLSQVKLAGLLGRSESWISQVERGVRTIDRISVLHEVAAALNVPARELAPDALALEDENGEPLVVQALRSALTTYSLPGALAPGQPAAGEAADLVALRSGIDEAWDLVHSSKFEGLGRLAPELLLQAEEAVSAAAAEERSTALALAAEAYQVTAATLAKLAETDMAWVAGDRAVLAALRAEEPLLAAAGVFRIGHVFLSGGRPEDAQRVADSAAAVLEQRLDDGPPQLVALYGALNLVVAIAATRQADAAAAYAAMRKAEQAAERLGEDRNDFHTEFGRTNVAVHGVSVAVELGDAGEALRRAERIDVAGLSPERRARFLIDVARASGQRRRTREAVKALLEAEELTPEQVRSHGRVRALLRDLLRVERSQATTDLRGLARRAGILR